MKEQTGTTDQLEDQHNESIYALLIRSEEKSRNIIEMAICPILILGAVIAIWQFAQQPVNIPAAGLKGAGCVACVDDLRATASSATSGSQRIEKSSHLAEIW